MNIRWDLYKKDDYFTYFDKVDFHKFDLPQWTDLLCEFFGNILFVIQV